MTTQIFIQAISTSSKDMVIPVADYNPQTQHLAIRLRGSDGIYCEYPFRHAPNKADAKAIVQSIYFTDKVVDAPKKRTTDKTKHKHKEQLALF